MLEARLLATVSRLAGPVRGAGVVLISLFGAFSVSSPLGWWLFAAVAVSTVADFRLPRIALPVAFLRVVVLSVLLGADADQWVLTVLTTTLITWQWQWPLRVTIPATAALLAVQVVTTGPAVLVRAVLESVLARLAYELLRRSSRRVDQLRERAAERDVAAAVALDQSRREREYLALLHDTAAATFLMAAHGGNPADVAAQARRDLVVLAERDVPGTVDLGAALTAVSLDSTVRVRVDASVVPVPAGVALAFVRAVRELLANVERHAGTGEASVSVTAGRGAVVVVADRGRGFVVDEVPEHRRGLRGSVVGRLEAVGGTAVVESGAGGTVARLEWSRTADDASSGVGGGVGPGDGASSEGGARPDDETRPGGEVQPRRGTQPAHADPSRPDLAAPDTSQSTPTPPATDQAVFTTTRQVLLVVVSAVQLVLTLPSLVSHPHAPPAYLAYALLTAVLATVAGQVAAHTPTRAALAAAPLAASVLATTALPPGASFGPADWAFGLVGWYLLLVLFDKPAAFVGALTAHLCFSVAWFAHGGGGDVGTAGVVILSGTSFQVGVLVITRVLERDARLAAEAAAALDAARTKEVLARRREQDLRAGFEGQLGALLPLLADLADERVGADEPDTRLRCSVAAVQLRRLFAENDDVPDPLLHELTACVDVAERRGVVVSLAVSGTATPVPTEVRRELVAPMAQALAAATGRAKVSLLRTATEVRVAVVADARRALPESHDTSAVSVETSVHSGLVRSEARWRTT
ncbi:hypothetical protein [Lentzea sp. NPDC003310]|uniref:sensor histidine kinase n=1 Tax=Lentzea sp. NPDC003310 TaxID=3154447 RepID=UPI0033B9F629